MLLTRSQLQGRFEEAISGIDAVSARRYAVAWPILCNRVNDDLGRLPNLRELIGYNPISVMQANHENHAAFMSSVFVLKSSQCLTDVLVWVYNSYLGRGFLPEYFEQQIHSWKQAIRNHIGKGSKSDALIAFYDTLARSHPSLIDLASRIGSAPEAQLGTMARSFLAALLRGDERAAESLTRDELSRSAADVPTWWRQVVAPALQTIGRRWSDGTVTVAEEHVATSIAQRVMDRCFPSPPAPRSGDKRVAIALPAGERHEMAGRMLRDCLVLHGFNVVYTGADTPTESIIRMLQGDRFEALILPTTMPFNLIATRDLIQTLRAECGEACPRIIVGGQAYLWDPSLWKRVGADACHQDIGEFIEDLSGG